MKSVTGILALWIFLIGSSLAFAVETIDGAGATFPYPIYSAWAFEYNKATGMQINYQSIGSGGGVKQITNRTVDFGASDEPVNMEQLEKDKLLQFPAVIGGVVLAVNIPGLNNKELKLSSETLSQIYLGKIKYWDDPSLKADNSELNLPHNEITVVYRSDGSGTTSIFTNYLSAVSKAWKESVGAGKSVSYPVGIGGKGNEGVANYVKNTEYAIGYIEYAYAHQNNLNVALMKNSSGRYVAPSFETFTEAAKFADFEASKGFYLWLVNAPGENAWPIAGATFILLAKENKESNKKVVKFFDWAFTNGDERAKELVYIPLPLILKEKIRAYWRSNGL